MYNIIILFESFEKFSLRFSLRTVYRFVWCMGKSSLYVGGFLIWYPVSNWSFSCRLRISYFRLEIRYQDSWRACCNRSRLSNRVWRPNILNGWWIDVLLFISYMLWLPWTLDRCFAFICSHIRLLFLNLCHRCWGCRFLLYCLRQRYLILFLSQILLVATFWLAPPAININRIELRKHLLLIDLQIMRNTSFVHNLVLPIFIYLFTFWHSFFDSAWKLLRLWLLYLLQFMLESPKVYGFFFCKFMLHNRPVIDTRWSERFRK